MSGRISAAMLAGLSMALLAASPMPANADPRLVLQITVDQLRGDLPTCYYDRLGEGGFKYLWEQGTVYTNAHHGHANNETVVGHATLATGADPADHGMVANVWFDRLAGETRYNIEDPRYKLLTSGADVDAAIEIDPTQRAARSEGRSPAAILVSTFSDQLAIHTGGAAKIFGVSVKDRGAVTMAGHAGKAFWFSKANAEFVTSTYYYDAYPSWVTDFNAEDRASAFDGKSWDLLHDQATYLFGDRDDQPWEIDLAGYGRTFPHHFGSRDDKYFTTLLTISPAGDRLTLDFAKRLILNELIGKDDVPDYLSISLSSTDYIGHLFGPSSLEAEDNILRLDQALADFFRFVDQNIGLENTLIVLSADHGAPEVPGYLNSLGIPAAYVEPDAWDRTAAINALKREFGIGEKLIENYSHPYLYLNRDVIRDHGLDHQTVEAAVAAALEEFEGVSLAISSTALLRNAVPATAIYDAVRRNFSPDRSGDIYIVFEPNRFINDFDGLKVASTHGSPWRYDSFVPIVFAGAGVGAQHVSRRVETVDVAPTLASFLHTAPPGGAVGSPLTEVLESR